MMSNLLFVIVLIGGFITLAFVTMATMVGMAVLLNKVAQGESNSVHTG